MKESKSHYQRTTKTNVADIGLHTAYKNPFKVASTSPVATGSITAVLKECESKLISDNPNFESFVGI